MDFRYQRDNQFYIACLCCKDSFPIHFLSFFFVWLDKNSFLRIERSVISFSSRLLTVNLSYLYPHACINHISMQAVIAVYNIKRDKTTEQTNSMAFSPGKHKSTESPSAFEYEQPEDSDRRADFPLCGCHRAREVIFTTRNVSVGRASLSSRPRPRTGDAWFLEDAEGAREDGWARDKTFHLKREGAPPGTAIKREGDSDGRRGWGRG